MSGNDNQHKERRKHPRVEMMHSVGGEVQAVVASSIINLSVSGTLVELPCRLNPGGLYEIQMSFAEHVIKTVAQVVVNWTLQQPGITAALCGAKRAYQIEETAGAMNFELTTDQLQHIERAITDRGEVITRSAV